MFGGKLGLPELIILVIVVAIVVKAGRSARYVLGGFLLGTIIGFTLRPSIPMIGQLPFDVVVTRGANLAGVSQILRSKAEESFNDMFLGGIIGAVVLGIVASATTKRQSEQPTERAKAAVAAAVPTSSSNTRFCTKCGEKVEPAGAFCAGCGAPIK